jgi:hypothetical protein
VQLKKIWRESLILSVTVYSFPVEPVTFHSLRSEWPSAASAASLRGFVTMYRGKSSRVVSGGTSSHLEPLIAYRPEGKSESTGGQSTSMGLAGSPGVGKGLF